MTVTIHKSGNGADKTESTRDGSGHVRDANGNTIGHWSLAVSDVEDDKL